MRHLALLFILLVLQPPPDPNLTARYLPSGAIVVSWTQQSRGCLATANVLIGCYEGSGRVVVSVGRVGPVDGNARGAQYRAEIDGRRYAANVRAVVYVSSVRA